VKVWVEVGPPRGEVGPPVGPPQALRVLQLCPPLLARAGPSCVTPPPRSGLQLDPASHTAQQPYQSFHLHLHTSLPPTPINPSTSIRVFPHPPYALTASMTTIVPAVLRSMLVALSPAARTSPATS
jgi:hypothetical protein